MKRKVILLFILTANYLICCNSATPALTQTPTTTIIPFSCDINVVNKYATIATASFQEFNDRLLLIELIDKKPSNIDTITKLVSQIQDIRTRITFETYIPCLRQPREVMLDFMNKAIDYSMGALSRSRYDKPTQTPNSNTLEELFKQDQSETNWDAAAARVKANFDFLLMQIKECAPKSDQIICGN